MDSAHNRRGLGESLARVVSEGNCSGCGMCAALFPEVEMVLQDGYQRPHLREPEGAAGRDATAGRRFSLACPGEGLEAPAAAGRPRHTVFGRHVRAWQAHACDPAIRTAGSSGGVLTALAGWLVETGQVSRVLGAGMDPSQPTRTVPVVLTSREEALASAGSRYAPVSVASCVDDSFGAVIAKPCEVAAIRARHRADGTPPPLLMSFFCAGTPSQDATDELVGELGHDGEAVTSLRYRGDGWPGRFVVTSERGRSEMSYDESWGAHLGRRLQPRCKICVDGTGEFADVAVGDFWRADERGFPSFDDAAGNSVVIARTLRGRELVERARDEGVLELAPVDLDDVAAVQPLQSTRRITLAGRLLGRRSAGFAVPRYRGFGLWRSLLAHPLRNLDAARGTRGRSRNER